MASCIAAYSVCKTGQLHINRSASWFGAVILCFWCMY